MSSDLPPIEQPASPPNESDVSSIDWAEILSVLWSYRRLIGIVTGIATVGAIIVSLILPEYYRSTATLLPDTEKRKLAPLSGLSDLAALAGVSSLGEGSLGKLYPTILKSESLLGNVIHAKYNSKKFDSPVTLIEFWDISGEVPNREYEVALETLRDRLEVSLDNKTNVVTLAIEEREPQLAADILTGIIMELDKYMRSKRTTNASEQRKWIEDRLGEVKGDLEKSENRLKDFREKNRRVGDSPQLLLEQGRLVREVEINSTLYAELKKQLEIVKIEEIKDIPIINVMDMPRPAALKAWPKRRAIVVTVFVFSSLGISLLVFAYHRYKDSIRIMQKKVLGGLSGSAMRL